MAIDLRHQIPAGVRLNFRGNYAAVTLYHLGDVVKANDCLWLALAEVHDYSPPSTPSGDSRVWLYLARATTEGDQSGAEIVAAIDAELGSAAWQGSGVTNLSVTGKTDTVLVVASDTGTDATIPAATDTEAGLLTAASKLKLDGVEPGAEANVDTDLAIGTHSDTALQVTSSTGADVTLPAATPTGGTNKAGLLVAADKTKLDSIEAGAEVNDPTNLGVGTRTGTDLQVTSSTGDDVTIPAASGTEAGLMVATDKTKLDGIEASADVNVDADLALGTHSDTTLDITSSTGTDVTLPAATPTAGTNKAGLLTAADKTKLDAVVTLATRLNISLTRTIPTVNTSTVDLGSFALTEGVAVLRITLVAQDVSAVRIAKMWLMPVNWNATDAVWKRVLPVASRVGKSGLSNDIALDASMGAGTLSLRLRPTVSSGPGETAYVLIEWDKVNTADTFTPSTTVTTSVTAPTLDYTDGLTANLGVTTLSGLLTAALATGNAAIALNTLRLFGEISSGLLAITMNTDKNLAFGTKNSATGGATGFTELMRLLKEGNLALGATAVGSSAAKVLGFGNGTAPTTAPGDLSQMWSADANAAAGKATMHMMSESGTGKIVVAGFLIKTDTGDPAQVHEGLGCINTFDNTVKIYADGGWRTIASGW